MCVCVCESHCKIIIITILIKKVVSEEVIYIVNGKKVMETSAKNLLGNKIHWLKQGHRIGDADHYHF